MDRILDKNGKAIPSNYEATDFWPEIPYPAKLAINIRINLKDFQISKDTQIHTLLYLL